MLSSKIKGSKSWAVERCFKFVSKNYGKRKGVGWKRHSISCDAYMLKNLCGISVFENNSIEMLIYLVQKRKYFLWPRKLLWIVKKVFFGSPTESSFWPYKVYICEITFTSTSVMTNIIQTFLIQPWPWV